MPARSGQHTKRCLCVLDKSVLGSFGVAVDGATRRTDPSLALGEWCSNNQEERLDQHGQKRGRGGQRKWAIRSVRERRDRPLWPRASQRWCVKARRPAAEKALCSGRGFGVAAERTQRLDGERLAFFDE